MCKRGCGRTIGDIAACCTRSILCGAIHNSHPSPIFFPAFFPFVVSVYLIKTFFCPTSQVSWHFSHHPCLSAPLVHNWLLAPVHPDILLPNTKGKLGGLACLFCLWDSLEMNLLRQKPSFCQKPCHIRPLAFLEELGVKLTCLQWAF